MPPLRSLVPVPHLTLHRKAFIALAALLLALLLIFVGFSRLGLQRGLGPYVAEIELARMDWLAERLQYHHTQTGGWDSLRGQPALWGRLTHPSGGPRGPGGSRPPSGPPPDRSSPIAAPPASPAPSAQSDLVTLPASTASAPAANDSQGARGTDPGNGPPPRPPNDDLRPMDRSAAPPQRHPDDIYPRLGLLDAQDQLVAGTAPQPGGARLALRGASGQVIGHLVLAPPQGVRSEADQAFLAQHLGFVAWTGLAGLVLALLLSGWPRGAGWPRSRPWPPARAALRRATCTPACPCTATTNWPSWPAPSTPWPNN